MKIQVLRLDFFVIPEVDICFSCIILVGVAKSRLLWLYLLCLLLGMGSAHHGASLCVHCCFYYLMRCNICDCACWLRLSKKDIWFKCPCNYYAMHSLVSLLLLSCSVISVILFAQRLVAVSRRGPLSKPNGAKFEFWCCAMIERCHESARKWLSAIVMVAGWLWN